MAEKFVEMIDKNDIERVKSAADLVAIAGRYTELRRNGSRFVACCPFHNEKLPVSILHRQINAFLMVLTSVMDAGKAVMMPLDSCRKSRAWDLLKRLKSQLL